MDKPAAPDMTDSPIAIHDGLAELADRYDAFILDLWGVLHNGVAAFPEAIDCLKALRAAGKRLLVLSNAPRRSESIKERNVALGLPPELYDALHSSGEFPPRSSRSSSPHRRMTIG